MSQMPTPDSIRDAVGQGLPCERIDVDGDGHHFQALIVSAVFEGKSRIERHRLVYGALGERMRQEIHALSMRTLTPREWQGAGADAAGSGKPCSGN